ncbi:PAS domain-containing protein [Seongchinamella sediminis]|uniref:histidine kinase n=1 Tax=Seongchinamella sediminis TaxID=2283635 RepID=A0A3L7DUN7_9GAMM|nr:ATP-binding protein [Seongchinamella sediminis]RLQ20475.1 PAS domain-containing protein [Seongchinamella sediminis]
MNYSLTQILLVVAIYLSALFVVALLADRNIIPRRISHHPAVYVLSLGVFAGATASNGVIEVATRYGYNFLLYYAGVGLMFVLAALLLIPLLRLSRIYQLASVADMLTFRFRSPRVGAAVTIAMCLAMLPMLALQIQAVGDSVHILSGHTHGPPRDGFHHQGIALLTCLIIGVFAILFGTRHVSSQDRNTGLVTAMAFESLVKLGALFVLMLVAVTQVFDGPAAMQQWLREYPPARDQMTHQLSIDNAHAFLLVFFAGAVCMPHIFHMLFAENTESRDLRRASWGMPLYLMLLSLPVLPVAWAGMRLEHNLPMAYAGLAMGIRLDSVPVAGAAFIATLSAASATIVVTTLALANMCLNHLVLPSRLLNLGHDGDIYRNLRWLRRALITVLLLAGFLFYLGLNGRQSLVELAMVAFSGTLQFLPGLVATAYWPNANRKGLLAGLWGGLGFWLLAVMLPATRGYAPEIGQLFNSMIADENSIWTIATMLALSINVVLFLLVSLLTQTSEEERVAAEICSMDELSRPIRQTLPVGSAAEFAGKLAPALGERTAAAEVDRALAQLQFDQQESRPYALRRLRRRVEANLSGLLGPAVAHNIVERCLPYDAGGTEDINLIERLLDAPHVQFTGLAADLDALRRRYRETLDTLPVGICSLGADGELLMWNLSMEEITDVPAGDVLGSLISALPDPWRSVLADFSASDSDIVLKTEVTTSVDNPRWVSLLKTITADGDTIILVEDISAIELMEEELLHNERLASIGRLAAGVAHEIGNPVTGIACLAQNLEYENDPEEVVIAARDILKQTERVSRIVESLVNFSHVGSSSSDLKLAPCNLADCVDEAVHLLSLDREARQVNFRNQCDRELLVLADTQRLLQVFVNILGNARDACDTDGLVLVRAYADGETVLVDVDDNGSGIPSHLQSQIFEPFFTTKEPGSGTGLGLALVYSIMEELGGSVQLTSPLYEGPAPGTRFTLKLDSASYDGTFEV